MSKTRSKRNRVARYRIARIGLFERLETRRLLAVEAMPSWVFGDHWHQGWDLTLQEAVQFTPPGPRQANAGTITYQHGSHDHDHEHECEHDHEGEHAYDHEGENHGHGELFVERPERNPELIGEGGGFAEAVMVSLDDTFRLHSRPNASHTIHLDFDGHVTEGTTWNLASGISSIDSPAYDPANNGSRFSDGELTRIQNIWKRVAEDFSPFDVNVTTEDPGSAALRKTGGSDTQWGTRVVITEDWDNCGCGGFAYLNSFNDSTDEPVFVFNTSEIGVSAASTHEVGHALGLSHDGTTSGQSYYGGHGSGDTAWGPIMGSGYYTNMTTWDSGAYYRANNSQDDWQIITSNNGFGYRTDDHGASRTTATPLDRLGTNVSDPTRLDVAAFGVIERESDLDWFEFETGDGVINLTIDSYVQDTYISNGTGFTRSLEATADGNQGSNLDIQATIYDSNANPVAASNPSDGLSASFSQLNLSSGTYYLQIDGVGFGNWTQSSPDGYDASVSRGQYAITGSIVATQQTIDAREDHATTKANTPVSISVLGNDLNPHGGTITIVSVGAPTSGQASASGGTITYTPDNDFVGSDSFTYTIGNGLETDTATVNITVVAPQPSILFVDDDQGDAFERFYAAALNANGFAYDTWEVEASGLPTSTDLTPYSVVIWNTGFEYSANDAGFSTAEQTTLAAYLDAGGSLFAIGQDILYNGVSTSFQTDYLKVDEFTSDVGGLYTFAGASGNAIGSGMNLSVNLPSDFSADWSDSLAPVAGAEGVFFRNSPNGNSQPYNTIGYGGSDFKVVFMAAPFEGISTTASDPNNQASVMRKVIEFFEGGNQSPVATDNSYSIGEDGFISSANVLTDAAPDFDPDQDPLIVDTNPAVSPTGGSVQLRADGSFTYAPNADFFGTDSFVYTVDDGNGGRDTGTVTITVIAEADVVFDMAMTDENTPVTTSVLANDNFEGSPIISLVSDGAHGTVTTNGVSTTYTPDPNFDGTDSYTYTASSGGVTETAMVSVTVKNLPAVSHNDSDTTIEDSPVTTNVLANDTYDGTPGVAVSGENGPANGSVTVNGDGSITYLPDPDFNGTDSYVYSLTGRGVTRTATVNLTVRPVDDAGDDTNSTFAGTPVSGSVTGNDTFSGAVTYVVFNDADHGSVTDHGGGSYTYTPRTDFAGTDRFSYDATDVNGFTETQVVSVIVSPQRSDVFYFSGKNSGTVGGTLQYQNEDIIAFDGTDYRIFFDGTPWVSGLALDAFAIEQSGDILMSFSGPGSITGESLSFDDSDIVRFSPASQSWQMYFDGSDVGLTRNSEDVDAIGFAPDGRLLISTTGTARVSGVTAADEDILAFAMTSVGSSTSGSWSRYFDGSDVGLSSSSSEDVDAISVAGDGTIYLSTTGSFSVLGLSGADEDVFVFDAQSLGSSTSGSFRRSLFFDGSRLGFTNDIGGMFIVDPGAPAAAAAVQPLKESPSTDSLSTDSLSTDSPEAGLAFTRWLVTTIDSAAAPEETLPGEVSTIDVSVGLPLKPSPADLGTRVAPLSFDFLVSFDVSKSDESLTDAALMHFDLQTFAETDSLDLIFASWS